MVSPDVSGTIASRWSRRIPRVTNPGFSRSLRTVGIASFRDSRNINSEARRALIKKSTLGLLRDVRFRGDVASRVSDHDARGRDGRPLVRQAPRDEIFARIEAQVLEGVA